MARYIVELLRPPSVSDSLQERAERLFASARQLSREGSPVSYLDTIFLPTNETCLHLFEAGSEAEVRAVASGPGSTSTASSRPSRSNPAARAL